MVSTLYFVRLTNTRAWFTPLADRANQYIDERTPWDHDQDAGRRRGGRCTLGLNWSSRDLRHCHGCHRLAEINTTEILVVASLFENEPADATRGYVAMRAGASPVAIRARDHCEDLWRDYAPLADEHFRLQFPLRTHERWFEMYLTVALLRAGLDVKCPKPGPDVLLTIDGRRIWIEATCSSAGAPGLPDSVPERPIHKAREPPVVISVPTDAITLRLRNSLHEKEQKFRTYLERGIVGAGDVAAVAINIFAVPYAWPDLDDHMRRTLYGLGHLTLSINIDTKAVVGSSYQERPLIEKKSTNAPVAVDPFVTGSMPHISAVIGSREDAANRPPRLGDGFSVYPNITATNVWPAGAIPLGQEWLVRHIQDGADLERVSYIPTTEDAAPGAG